MSAFSRRVGSKVEHAGASQVGPVRGGGGGGAVRKPTALRILPLFVVLPALGGILSGNASATLGSVVAFALLIWAGFLVHQGLIDEADYDARRVARPPAPRKTIGAAVVGASTFVLG